MTQRWMRLAVVLTALAATAGLAYQAFQDEVALRQSTDASRYAIDLADRALTTTADLRAALHAYVAPGQGSPFWVSRSAVLVDELQTGLTALAEMDPDGGSIAADAITKLVAAEKRARGFLRENQELLASDVVFTECRDQLEAIRLQIAGARDRILAAGDGREAALRREQYLLLGAILGAWALCALLLLPVTEAPAPFDRAQGSPDPSTLRQAQGRPEHSRGATSSGSSRARSRDEHSRGAPLPMAFEATEADADDMPLVPPAPVATPEPVAPSPPLPQPVVAKMPPAPIPRLPEAAQLCGDLARVSDGDQIAPLLKRAADVLDATGLIVWVTSADATTLVPAASYGYDDRMLARVGALPLDSENLTAAAFRHGARRTASARDGAPAAIAVPLVGPTGAIGVLSGEVRQVERVGETTSALASIVAAQLATLVGSMPAADTTTESDHHQITK